MGAKLTSCSTSSAAKTPSSGGTVSPPSQAEYDIKFTAFPSHMSPAELEPFDEDAPGACPIKVFYRDQTASAKGDRETVWQFKCVGHPKLTFNSITGRYGAYADWGSDMQEVRSDKQSIGDTLATHVPQELAHAFLDKTLSGIFGADDRAPASIELNSETLASLFSELNVAGLDETTRDQALAVLEAHPGSYRILLESGEPHEGRVLVMDSIKESVFNALGLRSQSEAATLSPDGTQATESSVAACKAALEVFKASTTWEIWKAHEILRVIVKRKSCKLPRAAFCD